MSRVHALLTAGVTLTNATLIDLTFGTEVYDPAEAYTPASGTFTAAAAGYYLCELRLNTDIGSATAWTFGFKVNGATGDGKSFAALGADAQISTVLKLEAGDTVKPHATQSSGSDKTLAAADSWFKIHRIS